MPYTVWQTVYGITLAYYREAYRPTCRRGREVWSDKAGAWISARDVLQGAPKELLERLAGATDAPLMRDGRTVDRDRLPAAWRKWAPSAWVDMLGSTDPEGEESEVSASAGADLSRVLAAALHTVVTMGRRVTVKGVEETQLEQRSLADWCGVLAKPGRGWYRMRSWHVWARREDRLRIALRPDLFTQLRRGDLPQLTLRQLNQLAQAHEIGGPVSVAGNSIRAMELRGEWIAEYLALPPSALGAAEWDPPQDGRTEEHSKGGCYAERLERPAAT